jgi:hypothetical protein
MRKEARAAVGGPAVGLQALFDRGGAYHKNGGYGRKKAQTVETTVYFRIGQLGRKFNRL